MIRFTICFVTIELMIEATFSKKMFKNIGGAVSCANAAIDNAGEMPEITRTPDLTPLIVHFDLFHVESNFKPSFPMYFTPHYMHGFQTSSSMGTACPSEHEQHKCILVSL